MGSYSVGDCGKAFTPKAPGDGDDDDDSDDDAGVSLGAGRGAN